MKHSVVSNGAPELEPGIIRELLDRLGALGVTVRGAGRGGQRLIVKGQPGFEHDTAVQAIVARLRWYHAANADEVVAVVGESERH